MNNKKVLVTGDVIVDHHVYEGQRSSPDSNNPIGSQEQTGPGGAGLIFELLKNVSQTRAKENQAQFDVKFGLAKNIYSKLNQNLHGYAVWKPCKPFGEQKEKVWRMVKPMGYGHSRDRTFPYADFIGDDAVAKPEIVVIDDGGLGFRLSTQKKAWPKVLMNKDNKNLEWIVLKMSNPIGQGDLWRHLSTNFQNKLIVIVSVDDVRKEEVRITKDTSWERSALDLVDELCHNPNINRLLNCKHLIINFGSEGALHVAFANTKRKFQLIYDPANLETEWGTKIDGLGLGFMSCITAGIVASLVKAKKGLGIQDVEFGIKAGLSAMRKMHILGHGNVGSKKPGIPFNNNPIKGKNDL